MNKKQHFGIIVSSFICLSLIVLGGLSFLYNDDTNKVETDLIEEEVNEKIPLYYNLDDPSIIYTRDESGGFEEIEING